MNPSTFTLLFSCFIFSSGAFVVFAIVKNEWSRKFELPNFIKSFYNADEYFKTQKYWNKLGKIEALGFALFTLLMMALLLSNGFREINIWLGQFSFPLLIHAALFFAICYVIPFWFLRTLPNSLYKSFTTSEVNAETRLSVTNFIRYHITAHIIALIVITSLFGLLLQAIIVLGDYFLIAAFLAYYFIKFLLRFLKPSLYFEIYALEEEGSNGSNYYYAQKLAQQLDTFQQQQYTDLKMFCEQIDFDWKKVLVFSENDAHQNLSSAFATRGKVYLNNKLFDLLKIEEVQAILAHEVGHVKSPITRLGLIPFFYRVAAITLVSTFVLNTDLSNLLGFSQLEPHVNLLTIFLLIVSVAPIKRYWINKIRHRSEYKADKFAARNVGKKEIEMALVKLYGKNNTSISHSKCYSVLYFRHPSLLQRIKKIRKVKKYDSLAHRLLAQLQKV